MLDIEKSLVKFLEVIKAYTGTSPIFSVDYKKGEIIIKDASSGFLKKLYADERVCAHLTKAGIKVTYFI